MSEYVMIHRAAFIAAMEELHAAFAATAEAEVRVPWVAGSVGIALGCLMDGLKGEEVAEMRQRFLRGRYPAD